MLNFAKSLVGHSVENIKGTLFNFACRSLGIFAKFLLVVYISKKMSFEALGLYNLVAVTVAWSVYVIGFEFHAYSLRRIVGESTSIVSNHVFNQMIFHLAGYSILFVLCPVLVALDFISLTLLPYFVLITIFDQISQEYFRICVALERSQFANFIHVIKSGLWVYPLLILPFFFKEEIDIHIILLSWLTGTVIACIIGTVKLVQLGVLSFKHVKLDVKWIKQGIAVAFPFLIISIAQLTMDFSDRYLIDYFLSKTEVGIYSFYYGIASVPITLITSVLAAQYYPRIINVYKFEASRSQQQAEFRGYLFQSVGLAVLSGVAALLLIRFLIDYIGDHQLIDSIVLFYLMLVQVVIFSVLVVVQTVLYAQHDDKYLLYSALGAAVLNILINLILIPAIGINGAALATIISMSLMLGVRFFRMKTLKQNAN